MKAMIFAAGIGSRLGEETAYKPKALVEIGGKPLLQWVIEKLSLEGIQEVVINVHHFAEKIIDFLKEKNFEIPVYISDESKKLLDTGGGLKKAAHFFDTAEPLIIYNVDIISNLELKNLFASHKHSEAMATLVVRNRHSQRYLKFDEDKNLVGWVNKKTDETRIVRPDKFNNATEMAFSGIHIVQPKIFQKMPKEDRFSIINLYLELAKKEAIKGFFDESDLWMDVGKPEQLELARKRFQ